MALRAAAALTSALDKVRDGVGRGFDKRDADVEAICTDVSALKVDVTDFQRETATRVDLDDLKKEMSAFRAEAASKVELDGLKKDVQALQVDMAVTKWMPGFLLAMYVAILSTLFTH